LKLDSDPLSIILSLPLLNSLGISSILIILLLALLVVTALVAGSEVAFFGLSVEQIKKLKSQNNRQSNTIINLLEKPKKLLATLLIANSFLSIGIIITTKVLLIDQLKLNQLLEGVPGSAIFSVLIQVLLVTFLLVLFGEVLPKVYATQNNMRMSVLCAPFISILSKFLGPFSAMLAKSSVFIEKNIKNKPNEISDSDVEHAIELTVGHSATPEEMSIFKGILKFNEITVKQIMKGRLDVQGLDYSSSLEDVRTKVLHFGYSRLPVYEETLDTIKGMIHVKDLLPIIDEENADWHQIVKPVYFVHESKSIEDLRQELQKRRNHLAVVVDEFGGTSGIVTLEDIMEEIIGDIRDEFDEDANLIKKINDTTYICEGKTTINDLTRALNLPLDTFEEARGESDSIAGLWLELAGKFPIVGETISYVNFSFMVMEVEKYRINKVKVTVEPILTVEVNTQ
jgi:putative hemolysin